VCKAAERDYQRARYRRQHGLPIDNATDSPVLTMVAGSDADSPADGPVLAAVRTELDSAPAAAERPGLAAVAVLLRNDRRKGHQRGYWV
jgi:hypothetical protein